MRFNFNILDKIKECNPKCLLIVTNQGGIEKGFVDEDITKDKMLMIGDASGKEGQFSDSDKKCAENFGIDYIDVVDFVSNAFL